MRARDTCRALAWALVLATAGRAEAYVRSLNTQGALLKWADPCIEVVAHTGDPVAPLTSSVAAAAVRGAAGAWGRPAYTCTTLKITPTIVDDNQATVARDQSNELVFVRDRWCRTPPDPRIPCYDPSALAITTMTVAADGTVVDADIEINAVNFKWDDLSAKIHSGDAADLQSTVTHEFGHLLGLDHNCFTGLGMRGSDEIGTPVRDCQGAPPAITNAVMFPSTVDGALRRRLSADETNFICTEYRLKANTVAPVCGAAAPPDGGAGDGGHERPTDGGAMEAAHPRGCAMAGGRAGGAGGTALGCTLLWAARRARRRSVRTA